mmetsp:Transcript_11820/g.33301  ORF Transcript_11820/g.33301 Transcript_11820/m.33301 type:complete len:398 (-) Transcript_11820:1351-2544(-)
MLRRLPDHHWPRPLGRWVAVPQRRGADLCARAHSSRLLSLGHRHGARGGRGPDERVLSLAWARPWPRASRGRPFLSRWGQGGLPSPPGGLRRRNIFDRLDRGLRCCRRRRFLRRLGLKSRPPVPSAHEGPVGPVLQVLPVGIPLPLPLVALRVAAEEVLPLLLLRQQRLAPLRRFLRTLPARERPGVEASLEVGHPEPRLEAEVILVRHPLLLQALHAPHHPCVLHHDGGTHPPRAPADVVYVAQLRRCVGCLPGALCGLPQPLRGLGEPELPRQAALQFREAESFRRLGRGQPEDHRNGAEPRLSCPLWQLVPGHRWPALGRLSRCCPQALQRLQGLLVRPRRRRLRSRQLQFQLPAADPPRHARPPPRSGVPSAGYPRVEPPPPPSEGGNALKGR